MSDQRMSQRSSVTSENGGLALPEGGIRRARKTSYQQRSGRITYAAFNADGLEDGLSPVSHSEKTPQQRKSKDYLKRPTLFSGANEEADTAAMTPARSEASASGFSGLSCSVVEEFAKRKSLYGKGKGVAREWWFKRRDSTVVWLHGMYYYVYATYIVCLMLTGATLMWLLDPEGDLAFKDAIYMASACVSQSGLATVNWSAEANSSHLLSFVLIIMGSMSLLTTVPAFLRRRSFRLQAAAEAEEMQNPTAADPLLGDNKSENGSVCASDTASDASVMAALDLEYRALGLIIKIVFGYWFVIHACAFSLMFIYIRGAPDILQELDTMNLGNAWHTLYLTISSFQNNGLVLTPNSIESFASHPVLLCTVSFLILAGNTGLPIFIRVVTWGVWRVLPEGPNKQAVAFLLEHPRRCYTHLFPGIHTLWLVLALVSLDGIPIIVMLLFDRDSLALRGMSFSHQFFNALVNSVSARTAGVNSVDIFRLSIISTFTLLVVMYISTSPTVVTMRLSALKNGVTELDITGRSEGLEDAVEAENTVKSQARRYLTQDVTYLIIILFLILVFENDNFNKSATMSSPDEDGIYNDFDFLKVCFEMASAYGTVGLSLGYRNAAYSFSGAWSIPSQLLLVVVMILGRLRGLPDSIDPSVSSTMHRRKLDPA
eukprot:TRINITY_DN45589_c0_g1_i1.p1 TRINITY_DN45589_c0_g1~~TRINITY_DN45589_c0_g1_i1.p1  ORF type:complete len:696 (-),score=129.35 TRINITY_DN45589_c0_g1_i1:79-2052(-)